jgi:prevent-host-death family protein
MADDAAMERIEVRELRREATAILRRVTAGETIEIAEYSRPVARIVPVQLTGLARLEAEGKVRWGRGDLLSIQPVKLAPGLRPPSQLVIEGRDE